MLPVKLTFAMAALIGALSGLLIGPTTTVFYDSGFLIGLKGLCGSRDGQACHSYPLVRCWARCSSGTVEAFASFWASAFKEVVVFSLVLPILVWRSVTGGHSEEH
jgi:branched-chain amino acid transport system permease protein